MPILRFAAMKHVARRLGRAQQNPTFLNYPSRVCTAHPSLSLLTLNRWAMPTLHEQKIFPARPVLFSRRCNLRSASFRDDDQIQMFRDTSSVLSPRS